MNVLYIDDDPEDRELFSEAIHSVHEDIELMVFSGCAEVLQYITSGPQVPEYIFMDMNMPKMRGFECARIIRVNERMKTVPIIMMSSTFNPTVIKNFSGTDFRFKCKPDDFAGLQSLIRNIVGVTCLAV